ncbi:unnamed protein product [Rotaria sp. Silwood1]|nr:unnamed protein product [Rotaria sp. Silwood1]
MHQQMIDTIEDLYQLSILLKQKDKIPLLIHNNLETSLEKFQQENNREKKIDIQLQILDKIDQLDNQFINYKTLENLRKHLHEEQKQQQGSIILSSNTQTHSDTHIQIIPVLTHLSKSPTMTIAEEKQIKNISHQTTIKPAISESIPKIDSVEQINLSLVTTNAKELYQELQKMKYSIEMIFENTQQVSDIVDVKVLSFVDVNSPKSNSDEQRAKNEEKFREKIKQKTRLVQLEKIKQEELEEIETFADIPFTSTDKDFLTKHSSIDITNKINELITFDNNEKFKSLHEISLKLSITVPSDIIPSIEETLQQQIDENKQVTVSYSSLLNDLSSRMSISQRKDSIISQSSKRQKIHKQKSLKKKRQSVIIKQIEDIELVPTINNESLSTQAFNIEQEN